MIVSGKVTGDGGTYYPAEHTVKLKECRTLALRVSACAGLHVFVEIYDPAGEFRGSLIRYKAGYGAWCMIGKSTDETSPNCRWGKLPAGTWMIRAAARPTQPGLTGEYAVEVLEDAGPKLPGQSLQPGGCLFEAGSGETRWRCGDLHSHTTMSDGEMTPAEMARYADKKCLDFHAITDHDVLPFSWAPSSALMLPGLEITTPNGHFNVIRPKSRPNFYPDAPHGGINTADGMYAVLSAARADGAFCMLNHPVFPPWHCRWESLDMNCVDALEILCDPTHPRAGDAAGKALAVWDEMLKDGRRIWGVGGSDSHLSPGKCYEGVQTCALPGDPLNYVLSDGTVDGIIAALKQGCCTVSRAGFLYFAVEAEGGTYLPGQQAPESAAAAVCVRADFTGVARIVVSGAVTHSFTLNGEEKRVPLEMPCGYVRVEALNGIGQLTAFSNPVFFGRRTPQRTTWGDYYREI